MSDWTPVNDPAPPDDFHVWAVPPCPNCPCCTSALCRRAVDRGTSCYQEGGGDQPGYHPLSPCPCAPLIKPDTHQDGAS